MNKKLLSAALGIIAASSIVASAAVITVTDGDAGGGLTLTPTDVVYAISFGQTVAQTVQGVAFEATNANVTINSSGPWAYSAPSLGGSANDIALADVFRTINYKDNVAPYLTSGTISGLAANTSYKTEFLFYQINDGPARIQTLSLNGGVVDTLTLTYGVCFNVQNTVSSDAFGQITYSYSTSTNGNSIISGVVVSAVPEPATWALLAGSLTTVMILRRRRA